jgi:hypothetical protein
MANQDRAATIHQMMFFTGGYNAVTLNSMIDPRNSKYHPSGSSPQTKRIKADQFSWRKRLKMYLSALKKGLVKIFV